MVTFGVLLADVTERCVVPGLLTAWLASMVTGLVYLWEGSQYLLTLATSYLDQKWDDTFQQVPTTPLVPLTTFQSHAKCLFYYNGDMQLQVFVSSIGCTGFVHTRPNNVCPHFEIDLPLDHH